MPGPVSDSYDPEFGTGQNSADVREGIEKVVEKMGRYLGPELKNIVGVVQGPSGKGKSVYLSEREMRIIRFGLNRSLEDWQI